jgi:hypothetical protein
VNGGVITYSADGTYEWISREQTQRSRGKYSVASGRVCVEFPAGTARCDRITKEGDGFFFTTKEGAKFKMEVSGSDRKT